MSSCEDLLSPFYAVMDKELTSNSLNIPTSFNLISRVNHVIDDPGSSIKDIANLVQSEPILLAKVLRMANSVAMNPYGGKVITSAFESVQRLGSKKIRCMVYLVVMEQVRLDNRSDQIKNMATTIWWHSLDVASMSYALAKHTHICDPDDAMLTGIMIDLGQFYILSRLNNFPEILDQPKCIIELLAQNHVSLTKQIIDALMLPSVVIKSYNTSTRNRPTWPMVDLVDVIALSNISTEYKNPYIQFIADLKKKKFESDLDDAEIAEIGNLLREIEPLRSDIFTSMSF